MLLPSQIVVPGGLLVGGAEQDLEPSQPPRPVALLQTEEAQRHVSRAMIESGGWRLLAAVRAEERPSVAVVCRDEVEHEIPLFGGQLLELVIFEELEHRAQLVAVAVQQARANWAPGLAVQL